MGVPDAVSAESGALQGQREEITLKRLVMGHGDAVESAGEGAGAPLASPTWADRDDRSGRTETTSAASDDEDEQGNGVVEVDLPAEDATRLQADGGAEAARDFRKLLRSMQCQLAFLQSMTQKIAQDEKTHASMHYPGALAEKEGGVEAAAAALSPSCLSGRTGGVSAAPEAARAAAANAESERFHRRASVDDAAALELEASSSPCPSPARGLAPAGASPKTCQSGEVTCEQLIDAPASAAEPEAECAIDLEAASQETRALQVEVQRLHAELKAVQQENVRLMSVIQRLEARDSGCEADNRRSEGADGSREDSNRQPHADPLQDQARNTSGQDRHAQCEPPDAITDSAMLVGNVFLDSESPRWLKGHERCQQRTHELWETIRTLALYVRTYSLERSAMREQRDDAIREAELAWAQNAALAGSRNPQQKIKYLQQLKTDNCALRKRIRELQALLVERSVSGIASSSPVFLEASTAASTSSSSVIAAPTSPTASSSPGLARKSLSATTLLIEADDRCERERNQVLQRMWLRQELLQAQLERLERQRAAPLDASPAPDAETPRAMTSPRGPPRSFSGRSPPSPGAALCSPAAASGARAKRKDARHPRAFDAPRAPIAHAPS